ncbi:MAG: hypothetical protein ABH832_02440 [bacterium]
MDIYKQILLVCLIITGSLIFFTSKADAATEYSCYCLDDNSCWDVEASYESSCKSLTKSCTFAKITCADRKLAPGTSKGTLPPSVLKAPEAPKTDKIAELKKAASALNPAGFTDPVQLIGTVIKFLTYLIGSIVMALYVYAGTMWMIAGGNAEKRAQAGKILVWTTLGTIAALASYTITKLVMNFVAV